MESCSTFAPPHLEHCQSQYGTAPVRKSANSKREAADMMRVLVITHLHPSPWFAHKGVFNQHQFAALQQYCSLRLIVPTSWTLRLPLPSAPYSGDAAAAIGLASIRHPILWYPPKVLRCWHGEFYRRSVRRAFRRTVADLQPQVVLAAWAYPDGWAAVHLAREANLPAVVKVHGSDVLRMGRVLGRTAGTLEALRLAEGVIAVSQDIAERLCALGVAANRIKVVYDGVDTEVFTPGNSQHARALLGLDAQRSRILFVGRLAAVKGLDVLLCACERLCREGLDFECDLVGEGPQRRRLIREILRRGLQNHVRLRGARRHEELAEWYRAADLFVLPSYSEGTPCALLEAAACGTPFVASCVGGVPEIAHLVHSRLVPAGDAGSLAAALAELLKSRPKQLLRCSKAKSHADAAMEITEFLEKTASASRPLRPAWPSISSVASAVSKPLAPQNQERDG